MSRMVSRARACRLWGSGAARTKPDKARINSPTFCWASSPQSIAASILAPIV